MALLTCALTLPWQGGTRAAGYESDDFSLRFPAAFSRFSSYASVTAMGNAQGASEWSSSANPASAAWPHPNRSYANGVSMQLNTMQFDAGTDMYVTGEAGVLNADKWGVFVPCAVQVFSNHERNRNGVGFDFQAEYYQMQWGRQLGKDWSAGINVNYTATDARYDNGQRLLAQTRTDAYAARIGVLNQPVDKLRVGLVFDYSWSPGWSDRYAYAGANALRTVDVTQRMLGRLGVAWQYSRLGSVYLDYQGGALWNNTGTMWVHRFPVGVEHWLIPGRLIGRAGATVDTEGNVSPSAGLGWQICKCVFANVAYQYGMFPELDREFGNAQTVAVSIGLGF